MIHINLLPAAQRETDPSSRKEIAVAAVVFGLTFMVAAGLHVVQSRELAVAQAEVAEIRQDLRRLRREHAGLDALVNQKALLEQKLHVVAALTDPQRRTAPVGLLTDLGRMTPDELWLTEFTQDGATATIRGNAVDNQSVAEFAGNLLGSAYFQNVEIRETVRQRLPSDDARQVTRFHVEAAVSTFAADTQRDA